MGDSGGVGDATCIELAAAVAALPELREINLGCGCVGDVGAAALAAALASDAKPRHLEALWLGGNAIGDVGACALAKTLEPRAGGGKPLHMLSPNPSLGPSSPSSLPRPYPRQASRCGRWPSTATRSVPRVAPH